jgi:hypothetical protein
MSYGKTKKNAKQPKARRGRPPKYVATETSFDWNKIQTLPLVMLQTPRGPIMGYRGNTSPTTVRLWAPAVVTQATPTNVVYLPVFPAETYVDFYTSMLVGTCPVPAVLAEGYKGYFKEFIKGSYRTSPIVMTAGVDAPSGEHVVHTNGSATIDNDDKQLKLFQ